MSKRNCAIVDIDGTLADCEHRRHLVERAEKNWEAFFSPELVRKDALIQPVAEVVHGLLTRQIIVFASGRPDRLREVTQKWLTQHGLWSWPYRLYMRVDGDKRPDTDVKREILQRIRDDGYHPTIAIDDRQTVVDMWREEGIICLQAAPGAF